MARTPVLQVYRRVSRIGLPGTTSGWESYTGAGSGIVYQTVFQLCLCHHQVMLADSITQIRLLRLVRVPKPGWLGWTAVGKNDGLRLMCNQSTREPSATAARSGVSHRRTVVGKRTGTKKRTCHNTWQRKKGNKIERHKARITKAVDWVRSRGMGMRLVVDGLGFLDQLRDQGIKRKFWMGSESESSMSDLIGKLSSIPGDRPSLL